MLARAARAIACALLGAAFTVPIGQMPVAIAAPEFPINTFTDGQQGTPAIAALANGGFVVVWHSAGQEGDGFHIYGQRFRANGNPLGDEFRINASDSGQDPAVAALTDGRFVVVWWTLTDGVRGQRFAANGAKLGAEFRVNAPADQSASADPAVAALAGDRFVAVWSTSHGDPSLNLSLYGQRFGADGAKEGARFRAKKTAAGHQDEPAVAALSGGGFVMIWTGPDDSDGGATSAVYGQRFAATGEKVGREFRVNRKTEGNQSEPAVAALAGDRFVAVFTSLGDVFGQRFSAAGGKVGPQFRINRETFNTQQLARIGLLPGGDFIVVWSSNNQDGSGFGVYGQRLSPEGAKLGPEFRVNQTTFGDQYFAAVVVLTGGAFVVVWENLSTGQGDIFGRRYAQ